MPGGERKTVVRHQVFRRARKRRKAVSKTSEKKNTPTAMRNHRRLFSACSFSRISCKKASRGLLLFLMASNSFAAARLSCFFRITSSTSFRTESRSATVCETLKPTKQEVKKSRKKSRRMA